ncbi:major capsid protein [bacterium]|nr:major capsid protein [bacterium]
MSGNTTLRMISAYYQEASPTAFFSGMFRGSPENFHNSEEVELDIERSEEDVSVVVTDLSTGYRMNSADLYTNKSFKPPIHKEAIALNAFDLIKRMPGQNPFESPDFRANIIARMFSGMRKVERKIRRSMEWQSSQVMQTGTVTLTDINGTSLYTLDYQPKAAHFPTAGTSWASATLAQKISDLTSLCDVIRGNGLVDPDEIDIGATAWENLIQTTGFLERFNAIRADLGTITAMDRRGGGGTFRGVIELGNYKLDVYTYNGSYKDPQTGTSTPFLDPGKVVVRSSMARMDATFGAIPNIGALLGASGRLIPEMPSRMSSADARMDLFTNIWMSGDGEQLFGGVGARPLMVPTAIDTYGCLDTQL